MRNTRYALELDKIALERKVPTNGDIVGELLSELTKKGWAWEEAQVVVNPNGERHWINESTLADEVYSVYLLDKDMRERGWLK